MVVFGLITKDGGANQKVQVITDRLRGDNLLKNPFQSWSHEYKPGLWVISIEPVYPNFGKLFFLPLLIFLVWPRGIGLVALAVAVIMFSLNLWWSKWFYYLLFAFRTGRGVHYMSPEEALERWYRRDNKKL